MGAQAPQLEPLGSRQNVNWWRREPVERDAEHPWHVPCARQSWMRLEVSRVVMVCGQRGAHQMLRQRGVL